MHELDLSIYAEARRAHASIYGNIALLRALQKRTADKIVAVDSVYQLKETSKLLDDLRKECDKLSADLQTLACGLWMSEGTGEPIRTQYCTGSPDVKQSPKTPKRGTPEYEAFCAHYGVPADAPFSPSWKPLMKQFSQDMSEGKPCPPGVDVREKWTFFKVKTLKRRAILDQGDAPELSDPDLLKKMYTVFANVKTFAEALFGIVCDQAKLDEADDESDDDEVKVTVDEEDPF